MMRGSCLCGTVSWGMDGPFKEMTHCHCAMCRKAHAAAFATFITVARGQLHWLSGREAVAEYLSSLDRRRAFCRRCGSVVPSSTNDGDTRVPAECLDDDPGVRPSAHLFAGSQAPWYTITDDLPHADTYLSDDAGRTIEQANRSSNRPGVWHGSCLCDAAAYEIHSPLRIVHNCHCSRCRKARAAAHATNGFTLADGLRYLRGVEDLMLYKLPSAQHFSHAFCRICGSGMPRPDAARGFAVVPLGTLDDDPAHGPDYHIFTAYKAPWYTIMDDLPKFAEGPEPPTRTYFES